jgi:hypothetical protein
MAISVFQIAIALEIGMTIVHAVRSRLVARIQIFDAHEIFG